jgi:DNA ligase 1
MPNSFQRWKNIQKCYPFEEKRLAKWTPPYICQPKYDGVRCRALLAGDASWILLSSEENIIFSVPHINEALSKVIKSNIELDGELYCHGMSFEEIVSITSRSVNIHSNFQSIKYHVFDVINSEPQTNRTIFIESLKGLSPYIEIAPFYLCNNLDDVMRAFDTIINAGYEGIIVRHHSNIYERKRSTTVMKFKPKKQDEYEITGFQEEIDKGGAPKGTLGALTCKSGDGSTFNVGTGFSHEIRQHLWLSREDLIGKIATVKYQHITTGRQVPRFPVFVEIKPLI